ncbi:transglutaminase-like domain-containing protein [Pseudohaliea rubra]|uniref:Transglutaminase-like enzyme, putative cysteine protease n=1 Tax=Pseudohaliea rubra DSM 19751 TaxID=1265313 RepID=A0A095VT67_9GAMM|nr:transglutaminase family protein [Pseudohaliea rubra]KGE04627.1 Transglutaminase-like enzyme, putative cysteine protease [Pseudohaliea rubra DSM 19751]
MWLQTGCRLRFSIEHPTPFVLMLRPRSGAQQWVASEEYLLEPAVPVIEFTDDYGNLCQRLVAPPGEFSLSTASKIMTADQVDEEPGGYFVEIQFLPDAVLKFLLPSRYCEAERFSAMAQEITAGCEPGYDQVAAIERWLRVNFRFEPGSSFSSLSAVEVNQQSTAVCRDFSHLGIALCRALGIPARMVVGCLHGLEPMEFHAWFEAYVAHRWYTFDATQAEKRGGYVAIGYGRDAADVAIYNQFGPPVYPLEQRVTVTLA